MTIFVFERIFLFNPTCAKASVGRHGGTKSTKDHGGIFLTQEF